MLILTVRPHQDPGRFDILLDGEHLLTHRQTILPAARKLLDMGYPPNTLLTMQVEGSASISFPPRPVLDWALTSISEGDRAMTTGKWAPHPNTPAPNWYST